MHVRGDLVTAVAQLDHLQCTEHGAGVIPVPMGKNDSFHRAHVEPKAFNVSLEYRRVGPGVEQQRPCDVATPGSDGAGQAVRSATQAMAGQEPTTSSPESRQLVLDKLGDRREGVRHIVDKNQDFNAIGNDKFTHAGPRAGLVASNSKSGCLRHRAKRP
jgi:hypothetical protein